MKHLLTKTKLVWLPQLWLTLAFMTGYSFLYWLLYIRLQVTGLKEDLVQMWVPMALAALCVFLFIRPRVLLLQLDKNDGKIRTLYYLVSAAVLCVPTIIFLHYLDTASGKLTKLNSITEIRQAPATRYYQPGSYVLHKSYIGVEPAMSYSGKNNQYLNMDIYIAMPFAGHVHDTLSSSPAFLSTHYHQQISSKISDAERKDRWNSFWQQSFEQFEKVTIRFAYLERMPNTEARDHLTAAAKKSKLYQPGAPVVILKPMTPPFDQRNGNKLNNALLWLGIGLVLWWIMILLPALQVDKARRFATNRKSHLSKELYGVVKVFKPEAGFTATPLLVLVNIIVFAVLVLAGLGFLHFYSRDLIACGALYEPLLQQGQWWRLLTSMFLHGGVMHLVMNMVSLYLAGLFLESTIGTKRFFTGYLLTGIAAALVSLWWHDQPVAVVGASGAIFGLYGILLSLIICKVFDAAFNKLLLILLAGTAGYSLVMGFVSEGIDNSAHIGGLMAGLVTGWVYSRQLLQDEAQQLY